MSSTRVGIVGDFERGRPVHEATNEALSHVGLGFEWVPTTDIGPRRPEERLAAYAGVFVSPGSPYLSMEGALGAIRHARERGVPLVGT